MLGPADNGLIDLLDHNPPPGANPVLGTLGNEFVDQISEIFAASSNNVLVYVSIEPGSLSALLIGVGKDAGNIEAGALQKINQNRDVLVCLARKTSNEVRPQTGLWAARTDGIDDV